MNRTAESFRDAFSSEVFEAQKACQEVLKGWGEYELDADQMVASVLLEIALKYAEESGERLSQDVCSFAVDCYFYYNNQLDEVFQWENADKTDFIMRLRGKGERNNVIQRIQYLLHICHVYDEAMGTATLQGIIGAFTRFAYLMIDSDSHITSREEEFYSGFKKMLAKAAIGEADQFSQTTDLIGGPVGQGEIHESSASRQSTNIPLEDLIDEINSLIGLENIKQEVLSLVNLLRVQKLREESGLPTIDASHHMVFFGNPGTGKTTIARKLGQIYKNLELLSSGHVVETDRSGLVAGYLGQTALKTKTVLDEAKGGILFIDEAYTLCQSSESDQYGQEAIDTILKYMEDNRDDLVVIVAGYEERMARFISSNPGLKSRFNKYYYFPDYSAEELYEIFKAMACKAQYTLDATCQERVKSFLKEIHSNKGDQFGNGRTVRNLFEKCVSNQANRVISLSSPTQHELMQLTANDILRGMPDSLELEEVAKAR